MRRPTSLTRSSACSPQTPDVSMANGTKSTPAMMSAYFCDFLTSAAAAAEPAWMLLAWTYDAAYVLGQVASQARDRPLFQGTCVTPSGRFPPLVHNECGSRVASVSVLMNARHSRSLTWLWRECLPEPLRQDRPWCPSAVTVLPHTQTCGRTTGAPRRKPAAMRTVGLNSLRPMLDIGRASSQSPEPGEREASRRALETGSTAASSRMSACTLQQGSSQARCAVEVGSAGVTDGVVGQVACRSQADVAMAIPLSSTSRRRAGRRVEVSSAVLAAEAR